MERRVKGQDTDLARGREARLLAVQHFKQDMARVVKKAASQSLFRDVKREHVVHRCWCSWSCLRRFRGEVRHDDAGWRVLSPVFFWHDEIVGSFVKLGALKIVESQMTSVQVAKVFRGYWMRVESRNNCGW